MKIRRSFGWVENLVKEKREWDSTGRGREAETKMLETKILCLISCRLDFRVIEMVV
jgi:hypothetical protein